MLETKIIAYDNRCEALVANNIRFELYWLGNVCYFIFYDKANEIEATDLFSLLGI